MKRPKRREISGSPHQPQHGSNCAKCVAWRASRKLGVTLAAFRRSHRHAYDKDGDHPPYVPARADAR